MANNQLITSTVEPIDYEVAFSYPATAYVRPNNVGTGAIFHEIRYAGAPSTLFANAPNGSSLVDTTNGDMWIKTLAVGSGINGTWTQVN